MGLVLRVVPSCSPAVRGQGGDERRAGTMKKRLEVCDLAPFFLLRAAQAFETKPAPG